MLTKKEAEDRIVAIVWDAALEEGGGKKEQARAVVRSCLEGYAETTAYVLRNRLDVAAQDALNSTVEDVRRSYG